MVVFGELNVAWLNGCMRFGSKAWLLVALACGVAPAQSLDEALRQADRHRRDGDGVAALLVLDRALAKQPDHPLLHLNRGAALGELGRHAEAIEALRTGLSLDPAEAEGRLTLAKVLLHSHRYREALAEIDRYAASVGELLQGFDGHYVRGLALRRLDRADESLTELRRAVAIRPSHADALINLAAMLAERGSDDKAETHLRAAVVAEPNNADARYRLARLLIDSGDSEEGDVQLQRYEALKLQAQTETRVAVLMGQGGRSMRAGEPEQAKEYFQQVLRLDSTNADALANLGVAYEHLGQGDLAEAMFRRAVEVGPDHPQGHLNLGLKLAEQDRFPEALESIAKAVDLAPDQVAAREGLAMVLTRLDRPEDAVPHFEWVVGKNSSSAEAHLNLGIALAESGDPSRALGAFDRAVSIAPEEFRPHYNRGRALRDLGRPAEARAALEQSIALNGQYPPSLRLLGTIERTRNNHSRAMELFVRVAELRPDDPAVYHDLALAAQQAGRVEEAVAHWERALDLDPRHSETLYNLSTVLAATDAGRARQYGRRFAVLKAERQDTDRAGALWNFALAEAGKNRWEQAFDLFRQALDACGSCPAKGQIHKNFGLTLGHAGDYRKALDELQRAQDLLPDDPEVRQALEVVRASMSQ